MTQHMMECQYPELFSDKTYSEVNCGMRKEIKSYCNYRNVSDAGSLLCENDHPSCENKTDGLHEWQARADNGSYIQCLKERLVKLGSFLGDVHDAQILALISIQAVMD
uniref:Uncharacterized protein n=1 Tax=Magallana gigas TaxID=29159 RepID=A0A8W8LWH8_MAGGI